MPLSMLVVPAAIFTAMYLYERRRASPLPLCARAARSTVVNALRRQR